LIDEPELELTELSAPADPGPESTSASHRQVLQALVQLLLSEKVIDPDKLKQTIESIARTRT
jgi:hypothetical protein